MPTSIGAPSRALEAFFAAIAAVDPQHIASLFAESGEIEDPIGSEIVRGRTDIEASFANGLAKLVTSAEVRALRVFEAGSRVAAHWSMRARGTSGAVVECDGIDVLWVNDAGEIIRVEGYWDAHAFADAITARR